MTKWLHGTSSFSEKSWVGPFYPPGTPPGEFLTHYATQFRAVEIDATYYSIPSERMVDGWAYKTPADFVICAKFPRSIVHCGDGKQPDGGRVLDLATVAEETAVFLERMSRLGPRLGPLVLQFPYFNRKAFASVEPFLDRLDRFLGELPRETADGHPLRFGVEIRNAKWLDAPLFEVLRRHRTAAVLVDLPYMPRPELLDGMEFVTSEDFLYLRLIGDRKAVDERTKTFDSIVLDKGDSLASWARFLHAYRERVPVIYTFANNHFAGHGPATIRDFAERVQGLDATANDEGGAG